jgi:hypothetical protein
VVPLPPAAQALLPLVRLANLRVYCGYVQPYRRRAAAVYKGGQAALSKRGLCKGGGYTREGQL